MKSCGAPPYVFPIMPSQSHSSSSSTKLMARKKPDSSSSDNNNKGGSEQTPPRITSNVKQNLQFIKLWKKKKSAAPKPATSYRRKKVDKEELSHDIVPYQDPTIALYWLLIFFFILLYVPIRMHDSALSSIGFVLCSTNQVIENVVPILLVDGYNVCGYWPKLKKHFLSGQLRVARQKLIEELITFSSLRDVKVVVVFDAMMSGVPTHKETFACIDVVFSGETCADAWIEKEVAALREDGCPKVWVATSDYSQQHAAHGAGAYVWSCKALITEIKASHKELEEMLHEHRSTSVQGKLLMHNIAPEALNALKDLRSRLSENKSS